MSEPHYKEAVETGPDPPVYRLHWRDSLLGAQMLFVAFGALVLVPILTGLNPNVALFTAGAGTLLFQLVTGGQVPVFLASSFAFIAPIIYGVETWGVPATLGGLAAAGLLYVALSVVVRVGGKGLVLRVLPPVVTGPVIMVIGIILAPVAVNMAMGKTGDGLAQLVPSGTALGVAAVSLAATVLCSLFGRGMLRLLPILTGIALGYAISLPLGLVSFEAVAEAPWLRVPAFVFPEWHWQAVVFILPVAIAPVIEHFGDVLAIGSLTGRNYLDSPGIHRTLLGDGLATSLAALLGGPPNTTYSEVTGAVALTRVFNPAVMTWAAIAAILLSFVGKTPQRNSVGAERQGLEDVAAAAKSAVDQNGYSSRDSVHDFGQDLDGRRGVLQVAGAVVGDEYSIRSVFHRESSVLGSEQAFDQNGQVAPGAKLVEEFPALIGAFGPNPV